MNSLPSLAKDFQIFAELSGNLSQITPGKTVILPQLNRPIGATKLEYSLNAIAHDVNMGRPMVVWIDNHPKCAKPEDGWHRPILT